MLLLCLKCRNSWCVSNTENKNPKVVKAKNWKIMFLSNSAVCNDLLEC